MIFGNQIDPAVLMASREVGRVHYGWQHYLTGFKRGVHDIEHEMVFKSNPGFVFHDSRGFEAGGLSEFDKVKAFIASRSKERCSKDRIHIIW
jgi:hypothetical protein